MSLRKRAESAFAAASGTEGGIESVSADERCAYPKPTTGPTAPADTFIELPHTTLVLDWTKGPGP